MLSVQKRRNIDGRQVLSDVNVGASQDLELMKALQRLDTRLPRQVSAEEPLCSSQQAENDLEVITAALNHTQVEFARAPTAESGFMMGHNQHHSQILSNNSQIPMKDGTAAHLAQQNAAVTFNNTEGIPVPHSNMSLNMS